MITKGTITTSKYEQDKLIGVMEAFAHTAHIPVTLFDRDMNILWECLREQKFCTIFSEHDNCNEQCRLNLDRAAMTAMNMNEPYVFMCASGLVGIVYPVTDGDKVTGVFMVGPAIVAQNKDKAVRKMFRTMPDFREYVNEVLELVDINGIRSSHEMSHIYEVFCSCIFSYRLMKAAPVSDDSVVYNLSQSVKNGDGDGALANMGLLYDRAYIANAGNVNRIKHYLSSRLEAMTTEISFEKKTADVLRKQLEKLKDAVSTPEIHTICRDIAAEMAVRRRTSTDYRGKSAIIRDALKYLHDNYMNDPDLTGTAEAVHTNPSYLSALFKKETGLTFSQNLNAIRLDKSAQLLTTTDMPVDKVAETCGFAGQSYFIRSFKENYGETPGKYRKKYGRDMR